MVHDTHSSLKSWSTMQITLTLYSYFQLLRALSYCKRKPFVNLFEFHYFVINGWCWVVNYSIEMCEVNLTQKLWKFLIIRNLRIRGLTRKKVAHLFPMHLFSAPWEHQKTVSFSDVFRSWRKGALETNGLKRQKELYLCRTYFSSNCE